MYSTNKYISIDDYNFLYPIKPQTDDVLMTRIGDIGTPALIKDNRSLAFYVSLALIRIKSSIILPEYLYYYIQTKRFKKELWNRTIHNAFPIKINKNEIGNCRIFIPNLNYQKNIIGLFKIVDKKIDIINSKLSILKKYKEGLLFQYKKEANKNGKTLKLASFCSLISGYNFNTNDYVTNGKFDIVTIGNVMDERYIDGDYKHVNFIPNSYIKLSKGDLLISMTGNVGRCSYVNDNNKLLNQRLCKFECEDTNKKFIYMITKTNSFKKRMNILAQGGAQPNLKNNDILNYVFFKIENNITHQKYVEAFDKIELLLEQSKRLTKNLLHLKKFLLNQLFI